MIKKIVKITLFVLAIALVLSGIDFMLFSRVGGSNQLEIFTVPQNLASFDLAESLEKQHLICSAKSFKLLLNIAAIGQKITPGGYHLSQNMNAWQILQKITGKPDLVWITISSCQRKEQIGEKLARVLGWNQNQLNFWNNLYTDTQSDYYEGVYYPDTYLIPVDASVEQVAMQFINRFNEKFTPLSDEFMNKDIKWTTGLKIASLIERETDNLNDMQLISGIIWNRLNRNMLLQIDATTQYTLGKDQNGNWWGTIDISQRQKDSPYNTYLYKGLPPTPICNPGINAIEATLNPQDTDCLFYLHDKNKLIHCTPTYEEHLKNIEKYLN